jgi:hypothetical protein
MIAMIPSLRFIVNKTCTHVKLPVKMKRKIDSFYKQEELASN